MRHLKLFLILWCIPLFADDTQPSKEVPNNKTYTDYKKDEPISTENTDSEIVDISKETESYETAFIKTITVLIGLLSLVTLTIWIFKKISRGRIRSFNYSKSIKILEKRPLSPKSMLYLVEVSGKQVLIAESQFEIRKVTTLDWLENDKDL